MLGIVDELERNGQNLQHFSRELSRYFRNLLVARIAGPDSRLIAASPREREEMVRISSGFTEDDLTRYLQIALDLFTDLQTSLQPRFHLEIGLLKMIQASKLVEIENAIANLGPAPPAALRAAVPTPAPAAAPRAFTPAPAMSRPPAPAVRPAAPSQPPAPPPPQRTGPSPFELDTLKKTGAPPRPADPGQAAAQAAARPDPAASTGDWREKLHSALTELGMAFTADAVEHSQFTHTGNELQVLAPTETRLSMKEADLQKAIAHLGLPRQVIKITFGEPAKSGPALEKKKTIDEDEVTTRALANPEVQRFRELFGGEVRAVRNLKE